MELHLLVPIFLYVSANITPADDIVQERMRMLCMRLFTVRLYLHNSLRDTNDNDIKIADQNNTIINQSRIFTGCRRKAFQLVYKRAKKRWRRLFILDETTDASLQTDISHQSREQRIISSIVPRHNPPVMSKISRTTSLLDTNWSSAAVFKKNYRTQKLHDLLTPLMHSCATHSIKAHSSHTTACASHTINPNHCKMHEFTYSCRWTLHYCLNFKHWTAHQYASPSMLFVTPIKKSISSHMQTDVTPTALNEFWLMISLLSQ